MNEKRLAGILNRCLEEIAAGETTGACLARYPEHAAELGPLLAMAGELGTLGQYKVSDAARLRAKAQLRRAEAARRDQRASPQGWLRPGFVPDAACGCRPGVHPDLRPPDGRDGRSQRARRPGLRAADRGGTDPGTADPRCRGAGPSRVGYRQPAAGRPGPDHAQSGSRTRRADGLSAAGQRRSGSGDGHELVRARADRDRRSHHRASGAVGATQAVRTPHTAGRSTASRIRASLSRSRTRRGRADITHTTTGGAVARADENPTAAPHSTLTPERTPFPSPSATATASPTPAPSATPSHAAPGDAGRQQTTTPQARLTATAGRNTPQATPAGPGPTATSPGPGPAATSPGPGPAATPSGPDPAATSPGPGPAATSPGPGPATTSPGPGPGRDFARPRTRRDLTRSWPDRDFARPRTHFYRTQDRVRPLSIRPDHAASRDFDAQQRDVEQATRTAGG